ncbi:MAG: hypothetical protein SFY68_09945 [Candidatus Sumerlaeia bacterium]|nr:hypothetical protein [Candidatus Sumerlaeia bacterium]
MADHYSSASGTPPEEQSVHKGTPDSRGRCITPWAWVPTVNFAQGLQYAIVIQLFLVIYLTLGIPNGDAVFAATSLGWPWVIKPLWGPLVERYWTKRSWTIWMQFTIMLCLAGSTFALILPDGFNRVFIDVLGLQHPPFFYISIVFLILMGFASATHDIACDGYYMLTLTQKQQSYFVGIRSTAFRIALITANGILLGVAFAVVEMTGPNPAQFVLQVNKVAQVAPIVEDKKEEAPESPEAAAEKAKAEAEKFAAETAALKARVESFSYAGEPTTEQVLRIEQPILSGDEGTTTSILVGISMPPTSGNTEVVILRAVPSSNIFRRLFLPSDTKGVKLTQERFVFTEENWRVPQEAVLTTPKKITESFTFSLQITAGKLNVAWAATIALCAIAYLLMFLLHSVAMPYPPGDGGAKTTVPFIIPLVSVAVLVALPIGFVWAFLSTFSFVTSPLLPLLETSMKSVAGAKVALSFASYLALIGFVTFLWFIKPIRVVALDFVRWISNISTIGIYEVFETFFQKQKIAAVLGFLLTYRLGEAMLTQMKIGFLTQDVSTGALGMGLDQLAVTNTVWNLGALTLGGIISGITIAKFGLKRLIWLCVAFMHLPNALYIYLAYYNETVSLVVINAVVAIEAFGYGFGFAAYLLIMIIAAQGPYKTAHYALCTGFMALGFTIPGSAAGYLQ